MGYTRQELVAKMYEVLTAKVKQAGERNAIVHNHLSTSAVRLYGAGNWLTVRYDPIENPLRWRLFDDKTSHHGCLLEANGWSVRDRRGNGIPDSGLIQYLNLLHKTEISPEGVELFGYFKDGVAVALLDEYSFKDQHRIYVLEGIDFSTGFEGVSGQPDITERLGAFWKWHQAGYIARIPYVHERAPYAGIEYRGGGDGMGWREFSSERIVSPYLVPDKRYIKYSLLTLRPIPETRVYRERF